MSWKHIGTRKKDGGMGFRDLGVLITQILTHENLTNITQISQNTIQNISSNI
jgi:hypothetical protein